MGQSEAKPEPPQATSSRTWPWKWRTDHSPGSDAETLRLVLVGPKGSGKSSAGNIILGREVFQTKTTLTCQTEGCEMGERAVTVVDTPGLSGEEASDQEVIKAIMKAGQDLAEPVVVLVVVPLEWNMKKSHSRRQVLTRALAQISADYVMVVITHAGQIQQVGKEGEGILQKGGLLQQTMDQCGRWFHLLNIAETDQAKASELMEKVDRMMLEGEKTQEERTGISAGEEEGTDYRTAISHLKRRVQKRVEVMKNSERIIAENKDLLRTLRAEIDDAEELMATVAEDKKRALTERVQEKSKDVQAKEEKIRLHIGILQTLQQQVKEKQQHIREMEKKMRDREKEWARDPASRAEDGPSDTGAGNDCGKRMGTQGGTVVTSGGMHSFRKDLQKLEDQLKAKRKEEEELVRERNLDYKAQLQRIKAKMVNNE